MINSKSILLTEENDDEDDEEEDIYEFRKWFGIRRSTVLLLFYVISYFSFLFLGGYVMSMLETPHEECLKNKTILMKEDFLKNNPHINRELKSISY